MTTVRRKHLALLALGALLLTACREPPATTAEAPARALPAITVSGGAPREYTAVGSVVAESRIEVSSRLSGYVRELPVREGDAVRRGQVIARLDAADVDSGVRQAQAALASAEAAQRDALADRERYDTLFAKGLVSENEARKIRLREEAARESLNQARAALDQAQAQRDYTDIRSPVDGVVVARLRRAGDLAVPGMPLLQIETTGAPVFETTVTEQQVGALRNGQTVRVRIDGVPKALEGRIARIVASADPVTRTYPVKIALPPSPGLLPGMFGRADFTLGTSDTLLLPRALLVERGGLTGAFVLDANNRARFRWLRLGREWPRQVEVLAGLAPGERVVQGATAGGGDLREGERIAIALDAPAGTPATTLESPR